VQQYRYTPSRVGQQSPASRRAAHPTFSIHLAPGGGGDDTYGGLGGLDTMFRIGSDMLILTPIPTAEAKSVCKCSTFVLLMSSTILSTEDATIIFPSSVLTSLKIVKCNVRAPNLRARLCCSEHGSEKLTRTEFKA
jgi:hypothetical protein